MIGLRISEDKILRTNKVVAVVNLIVAPVVYLVVAIFIKPEPFPDGSHFQMTFRILLVLALLAPFVELMVNRVMTTAYRNKKIDSTQIAALFHTACLVKQVTANVVFIFGMVTVFISHQIQYLFYFYSIGIVLALMYWPTDKRWLRFKEKLEQS